MDPSEDLERNRKVSDDLVVVEDAAGASTSSSSAGRGSRSKKTRRMRNSGRRSREDKRSNSKGNATDGDDDDDDDDEGDVDDVDEVCVEGTSSSAAISVVEAIVKQKVLEEEEEPRPGPSTSAAQFDLEVFDSGSSCSIEDCIHGIHEEERGVRRVEKGKGKSSTPAKRKTVAAAAPDAPDAADAAAAVTKETSTGGDATPIGDGAADDDTAVAADAVGQRLVGVPISACPSDDEATADKELEDMIMTRCYGAADKDKVSEADGEDPSPSSSSSPVPSTSNNLNFPPKSTKTAISMATANDDDDGNDNIDEIVQDHDNFGTDENEDSMDSIMELADDNKPSDISLPVGASAVEESLSALGEVESCCGASALRSGSKRKSDEDGLTAGGGGDDDDKVDLVKVKKQCIEEAFREQGVLKENKTTKPHPQDTLMITVPDYQQQQQQQQRQAPQKPPSTTIIEPLQLRPPRPSPPVPVPIPSTSSSSMTSTTSSTSSCSTRSKLIPDKDNPPAEITDWIAQFAGWSHASRLLAIDQLIAHSQPMQVRHMMAVIEPQFQRDFISLLPKELALYILSFLSPRDLLRSAQTCRYWRILAEDNLLWREKCRESGLMDSDIDHNLRYELRQNPNMVYSQRKARFMRNHYVELNWRSRSVRPPRVLKGHDEHVITCLQFNDQKIVSGSDDNTLKVWSAASGKCLRTLVGHTGGVWSSQMEGDTVVSGSTDRTLKVWDSESGACVHTLYGHTSTVRCMHLHKNKVVSGSRDATLRVWDIVDGECLHVLIGHVAAVRCVQYDGRLVVSGAYDYMVKVWNPEREECIHTLAGHTNRVYSLQFDGVHVVSGSLDTSIRVWDVETGACRHALMGHQSLTSGMELRNNILVSGNADSTVKVWDIISGACLQTLSGSNKHQSAVTCLQFNSKFVITSSDDGTVKLWDVKTGEFIRDLVALPSGGSGGVVWRIRANHTKLICAVGSRNGTEETKLLVLDFDAQAPTQQQRQQHHHQQFIQQIHSNPMDAIWVPPPETSSNPATEEEEDDTIDAADSALAAAAAAAAQHPAAADEEAPPLADH